VAYKSGNLVTAFDGFWVASEAFIVNIVWKFGAVALGEPYMDVQLCI
jgi:hypothetical protein